MTSVEGPISRPWVIPSWISGLPALPIAQMRPSRIPMSALDDAPVIEDDGVGDDEIRRAFGSRRLRLSLPVANHLAASEDDLFAVAREVAFDLEDQAGVAETNTVAGGRTIEVGVGRSRDSQRGLCMNPRVRARSSAASRCSSSDPATSPLMPCTWRLPPRATRSTSRPSPGSKRSAVPAGMSSRQPYVRARSNTRKRFTSKKWVWDPTWIGRSPVLSIRRRTGDCPSFSSIGSDREKVFAGNHGASCGDGQRMGS